MAGLREDSLYDQNLCSPESQTFAIWIMSGERQGLTKSRTQLKSGLSAPECTLKMIYAKNWNSSTKN